LSNVRIYARLYRLDSDWSDDTAFWTADDDEQKIGETSVLRADETFEIALGERDGDTASPLIVLGKEFKRGNNYWPYLRVNLRAIADEGSAAESLAILAPGYVFNTVIEAEMVPLTIKAFSLVELPSRQSLPGTAQKTLR
jgi:hypothetical protein